MAYADLEVTLRMADIERWLAEVTDISISIGCSSECSTKDTNRDGAPSTKPESPGSAGC